MCLCLVTCENKQPPRKQKLLRVIHISLLNGEKYSKGRDEPKMKLFAKDTRKKNQKLPPPLIKMSLKSVWHVRLKTSS